MVLKAGVDVKRRTAKHLTKPDIFLRSSSLPAVVIAIRNGHEEAMQMLSDNGADINGIK
jgi:hypothetical protein